MSPWRVPRFDTKRQACWVTVLSVVLCHVAHWHVPGPFMCSRPMQWHDHAIDSVGRSVDPAGGVPVGRAAAAGWQQRHLWGLAKTQIRRSAATVLAQWELPVALRTLRWLPSTALVSNLALRNLNATWTQ